MDSIQTKLHSELTPETIQKIIDQTDQVMTRNYKALSERAQGMADANTYQTLLDFCFEQTEQYVDNPDNMMKIMTDSHNIQPVYNSITNMEEFKEICGEEYKGFPRVILMTVLAGAEAAAAHTAHEILSEGNPEVVHYLDGLAEVYHKYLTDAIAYGKGDDKKVVMTGQKQ